MGLSGGAARVRLFKMSILATEHSHIVFGHRAVIVINGTLTTYALDCTAQNVACEIAARLVALIRLPT